MRWTCTRTRILAMWVFFSAWLCLTAQGAIIPVWNALDEGEGSLRDAISQANDGDQIDLMMSQIGDGGTLRLNSGLIITNRVAITTNGKGRPRLASARATIDTLLITITTNASVTIRNVIIEGQGTAQGFVVEGSLSAKRCDFHDLRATEGAAIFVGPSGEIKLDGCVFRQNLARRGAGIFNHGRATLDACEFTSNTTRHPDEGLIDLAIGGSAIFNAGGSVKLKACLLDRNYTEGSGAGIYQWQGVIELTNGTRVINNRARRIGGGIYACSRSVILGAYASMKDDPPAIEELNVMCNHADSGPDKGNNIWESGRSSQIHQSDPDADENACLNQRPAAWYSCLDILRSEKANQAFESTTPFPKAQSFRTGNTESEPLGAQVRMYVRRFHSDAPKKIRLRVLSALPRGIHRKDMGLEELKGNVDWSAVDQLTVASGEADVRKDVDGWLSFSFNTPPKRLEKNREYFLYLEPHDPSMLDVRWYSSRPGPETRSPYRQGTGWVYVYDWNDNSNYRPQYAHRIDYAFRLYLGKN